MQKKKIIIFASGNGTNAQRIIEYFIVSNQAEVSMIFTNNPQAYVIQRAKMFKTPVFIFNKTDFYTTKNVMNALLKAKPDLIVLAGFLWLIPAEIIKSFPDRIVNIHPALLPKYGGKGMYGTNVHRAVIFAGEKESGISIHYVNENYDDGSIIFQAKCTVDAGETPDSLAMKIHQLEHKYFPVIIENLI